MDNKQFKKILKESLSTGASSLFEEEEEEEEVEEEAEEEQEAEPDNNSELVDYAQDLLPYLEKVKQEIGSLESELKISPENFARIFGYYYVSLYYNDDSKWKYTIATPSRYKTLMTNLLDKVRTNIVCEYVNVIKLAKEEKMFKNPTDFLKDLQSSAPDREVFVAIASVLNRIYNGNYDLDSSNTQKLQALIDKVGNFDPKKCKSMTAPSRAGASEEEGENSEEKDEAVEEFQKLDLKVGDVVVVKNRNGKEIVTTVAEIPDELIVKENQWKDETAKFIIGGDWSIPLGGKRGFNSKGQHWIAIRDKKVAIRKATTQDIQKAVDIDPRVASKLNLEDKLEDAETEEIPREDVETYGTPEEPQAFKPFLKGLEKVPVIRNYADEIVSSLKKDIPDSKQASLMPNTIDELLTINEEEEEEEVKYRLQDSENIQNIIKKIADDKLVAGKWAYTLIKRFLSRNGMDLKQNAEINMKALRVIPRPEDIVPLLKTAKAVERNLEEQRYYRLLERFNIK